MKKTILTIALSSILLSACGGSDSDSSNGGGSTTPTPKLAGYLTDGAIENVSYETSSGVKGTTDSEGKFNYNSGDKVTFFIGDIQLNSPIEATGRITPTELFPNDTASQLSLMVFLQSLDEDHVSPPANAGSDYNAHDNGIKISSDMISKIKTNLGKSTFETLIKDENVAVILSEKLAVTNPVSPETASQNFVDTFYKDIAGTWEIIPTDDKTKVFVVIKSDGTYVLGEADYSDDDGQSGYEIGNLNWNFKTKEIAPKITVDSNGSWGLSDPDQDKPYKLSFDSTNLNLLEPGIDETYTLRRVTSTTSSIVGTWELGSTHTLIFTNNNLYFMVDTQGGDTSNDSCGGTKGIEYGKYSISGSNFTITDTLFDTNGSCGFQDNKDKSKIKGTYSINTSTLTLSPQGESSVTLKRLY